jgi:peptide/nickel transport system substrate-binding protein
MAGAHGRTIGKGHGRATGRTMGYAAVLGAAALVLAACGAGSSSSATGSSGGASTAGGPTPVGSRISGGTVSVAEPPATTPNWIFPMAGLAYFSVYNISDLQQPMYKPLYWFGGHGDQPTIDYGLSPATAPTYAADGRSVTIPLKGWKWSDGETVDAKDVQFWINMVKAEKTNWAGYVPGAFPDNISKVTVVGPETVKLSLTGKYSDNWFTYTELSQITPMPMAWDVTSLGAKPGSGGCTTDQSRCAAVYDFLVGQAKDMKSYAASKVWSVVDGAWKLGSFSSDGNYTLVPNPAYSGSPKPTLDAGKFLPFTSDSAEFNVLKAGNTVDVGYIPSQDLPAKPASAAVPSTNPAGSSYNLVPAYTWSVNYFVPNFNNPTVGPILQQLYVRQALQQTLDQPVDVAKALQGYGYPNFNPVPVEPSNPWLSPKSRQGTPYPFSIIKAKALLTEHGWTEKGGVMTCTSPGTGTGDCGAGIKSGARMSFQYHYASGTQSLSQEMQQYKSDAAQAGIQLTMKAEPFNSVIGESVPCTPSQSSCSWQISNWGGGWIYAPDFLPSGEDLFATGAGSNSGSYSDAKMDRLIQATEQQNGVQPMYAYQDYAGQQLPVIFQANGYTIGAISDHVGGVNTNPLGSIVPEYWYRTK